MAIGTTELVLRGVLADDLSKWNVGPAYSEAQWLEEHYAQRDALFREKYLRSVPGHISVLGIGDSFTFGNGVPADSTYLARLAASLEDVVFNNLAKEGFNAVGLFSIAREYLPLLKPDVVVYGLTLNDLQIEPEDAQYNYTRQFAAYRLLYHSRLGDWLADHSYLFFLVRNHLRAGLEMLGFAPGQQAFIRRLFRPKNLQRFSNFTAALQRLCANQNATLIVALLPMIEGFETYPFTEQHLRLETLLQSQGVRFVDALGYFGRARSDAFWVNPYDHHPNAEAHARFARALQDTLLSIVDSLRPKVSSVADTVYFQRTVDRGDDPDARGLLAQKKITQAIEAYTVVAERTESPTFQLKLGSALFKGRQFKVAVTACRQALRMDSTYVPALVLMGASFLEMGDLKRAEMAYERALAFDPLDCDAQRGIALLLISTDRHQEAKQRLQRLAAQFPEERRFAQQLLQAIGNGY